MAHDLKPEGWDHEMVARHVGLMIDAGLLDGELTRFSGGGFDAYVRELTWDGYDFLDSVRDDEVWQNTRKSIAGAVGSASFEVIKAVATAFVMKAVGL